jgi:hypothetical protein
MSGVYLFIYFLVKFLETVTTGLKDIYFQTASISNPSKKSEKIKSHFLVSLCVHDCYMNIKWSYLKTLLRAETEFQHIITELMTL